MDDEVANTFSVWDYLVFSLMLLVSVGIGIYHGFIGGGKQKTAAEFLLADGDMNPIPVAMSLTASFISAITFLGTPAEIYIHGTLFIWFGIAYILTGFLTIRCFMPMFFRSGSTSAYESLRSIIYLVGARAARPEKHRHKTSYRQKTRHDVRDAEPNEQRPVDVNLRRRPQEGDRRNKARRQRHRHRDRVHVAVSEQEFGGGLLLAAADETVVDPYADRHEQHEREDQIVPDRKCIRYFVIHI
eukprot:XP_011662868.1 PREDICTED: uncharacterized protein LOC105437681 [Strongylocentrotus purpuratus]